MLSYFISRNRLFSFCRLQGSVSSVASGVNLFRTKVVGEQTPTFLRTDFIAGRSMLPDFFAAVREREFC